MRYVWLAGNRGGSGLLIVGPVRTSGQSRQKNRNELERFGNVEAL